jgi:hypothetical protein
MRRKGIESEFRLAPAHIGIAGNERADNAAKEATGCGNLTPGAGKGS